MGGIHLAGDDAVALEAPGVSERHPTGSQHALERRLT